ncbi:4-alpha-glucanotransferase [Anaerocaecibacter muris]|uniref:4-alpha-glucanotransferase n=1 Tax=Anaerocaecibacter muris TaxID=2941513 RepID=UPI00203AA1E0|nr:4-alpha-glucanotransferase [Anaerocaecibacter muris]
MERKAGVLMHISSLHGNRGIGSMGKAAYEFVDFMAEAGLSLWQVLPLCPTSYGDSPYQSPSAIAGNPYFIDLDELIERKLLKPEEAKVYKMKPVDYAEVYYERFDTLRKAYKRFIKKPPADYQTFKDENAFWLDDYALFMALKEAHDMQAWYTWEDEFKHRTADLTQYEKAGEFHKFLQYEFFRQWLALKNYANSKGIKIVGDMPIYVAHDSVEVWSNPKQFLLNDDLSKKVVAGVPPDYFSADGQLWGNPIYDWDYMRETNYDWWVMRMSMALKLYDIVRIDHFRAFADYYVIPADRTDARVGEWKTGPGMALFNVINEKLNNPAIIAEDLGELHDCVRELVRETGYPGMKIMQFAFDGNPYNDFYYTNYKPNCVAYTGTHDNDTTRGWFESLDDRNKELVRNTLGYEGDNVTAEIIDRLFSSAANTVIIPMQDFLNLPATARMNIPSTLGGNWAWRSDGKWAKKAKTIRKQIEKYDRL